MSLAASVAQVLCRKGIMIQNNFWKEREKQPEAKRFQYFSHIHHQLIDFSSFKPCEIIKQKKRGQLLELLFEWLKSVIL
jgi:hypothetical protein